MTAKFAIASQYLKRIIHLRTTREGQLYMVGISKDAAKLTFVLRGCLKSSNLRQPLEHKANHGQIDEGFRGFRQSFVIFAQTSTPVQPAKGPLDDPTLGQNAKALLFIAAHHRFEQPSISVKTDWINAFPR